MYGFCPVVLRPVVAVRSALLCVRMDAQVSSFVWSDPIQKELVDHEVGHDVHLLLTMKEP
jgi:hypothetical protein